jgi:hypothetical protein
VSHEDGGADTSDADLPSARAPGTRPAFFVYGARRDHPRATELATAAHAMLVRYATEVVSGFGLCPFLRGVDAGLGAVGIVLDVEPDIETAIAAIAHLKEPVVHLSYPLVGTKTEEPPEAGIRAPSAATKFERFGSKLAEALRKRRAEPLVHATFHPELVGGRENAYRLIGLLRQAPDPFVQFVPPGLMKGENNGALADQVLELVQSLKGEREANYGDLARLVSSDS